MSKVVVIGAGITGITTAYSLAKRGYKVQVIDAESYPAMKTSYANGGQLSVSNSEVWYTYENLIKAAKWIFTKDAPLLINPYPSVSKISWMARFALNTVMMRYESNTVKTIEMGLRARDLYFAIADEEKIKFDLTKQGILHFYKNNKYYDSAVNACELYQKHGVDRRLICLDEMKSIEPALAHNQDIIGATYTKDDANGDIHKFCTELAAVLESRYNVEFYYNMRVDEIVKIYDVVAVQTRHTQDFKIKTFVADHAVICSGVDSAVLAKKIKDRVPVYPVKGYSITINLESKAEQEQAPLVSLLDDEAKIVTSRLGNRFRVAGTAELADYNLDIRKDRIDPLVRWVTNNFPFIKTEHINPWAGLRPMTPDMLPIVRQSNTKNIWFNTGHGHLGWTLSAATAEMIADLIHQCPNDNQL